MGFEFLSTPAYLALLLFCSITMFFYGVKYLWKKEKLIAYGLGLLALSSLGAAFLRVIKEYFPEMTILTSWLMLTVVIFAYCGAALIGMVGWKRSKEDPAIRKQMVISLCVIIGGILIIGLVVLAT